MKSMNLKLAWYAVFLLFSLSSMAQTYEQEFQQRANSLLNQVADRYANLRPPGVGNTGNPSDPEKFNWPQVIARLHKYGNNDDTSNARIDRFKNNSPFHFTLAGMARIMNQFPNAPQMVQNKQVYLSRIFSRNDSYNAWTDEGTENHNNMARTSGYLAAQNASGNASFPDAQARLAQSKTWILEFSKRLYTGGAAEWNSTQYHAYNVIGWLNLFDFAADPEVKAAARAVLDYYAVEIAIHHAQGWFSGPEMRSAGVSLFGVTNNQANNVFSANSGDYLGWLWFGDLSRKLGQNYWTGNEYIQSVHAAISSYRPPHYTWLIAKKEITLPAEFRSAKAAYYGKVPAFMHQQQYEDRGFSLGTAYMPYGGWGGGSFAILSWKLVGRRTFDAADSVKAPEMVSGTGRYYNQNRGRGRQPYDQFVQHKNVLIQMTKTPTNAAEIDTLVKFVFQRWDSRWATDFIQRFSASDVKMTMRPVSKLSGVANRNESYISYPTSANVVRVNNTVFVELENCFMAIRSLHNALPSTPTNDNNLTRQMVTDVGVLGSICGFALEAANKADHANFAAFQTAVTTANGLNKSQLAQNKVKYTNLQGDVVEAIYQERGSYVEPIFDWGYGPTTQQIIQTTPPYIQPDDYPTSQSGGRVAKWTVNADTVRLDSNWPLYEGGGITFDNENLRLDYDSAGARYYYNVDYTGTLPVFTSGRTTDIDTKIIKALFVYPNPVKLGDDIIVQIPNGEKLVGYKIYSQEGKLMQQAKLPQQAGEVLVQTKKFKPGLYRILLETQKGTHGQKILIVK